MSGAVDELWAVIRAGPQVDADALARAVERAAASDSLDFRTRLLVRDSVRALTSHWDEARLRSWLSDRPNVAAICADMNAPDDEGFPSLPRRIVDATRPGAILNLIRELSVHVTQPTRLTIGGSTALILAGLISRYTEDIDVVDELPPEVRSRHELLDQLIAKYGLRLAHFQSHYLPAGWQQRLRSLGVFDKLQVFTIDVYDVIVGKLFSLRRKDHDDLWAIVPKLDRDTLVRRVRDTTASFRSDPKLLDAATKNWFVLFGEGLPP